MLKFTFLKYELNSLEADQYHQTLLQVLREIQLGLTMALQSSSDLFPVSQLLYTNTTIRVGACNLSLTSSLHQHHECTDVLGTSSIPASVFHRKGVSIALTILSPLLLDSNLKPPLLATAQNPRPHKPQLPCNWIHLSVFGMLTPCSQLRTRFS